MLQHDQVADGGGADGAALDPAIVAEQIRLLIHKRVDLPINLVNAGIVSATLWPLYPNWIVLPWLVLFYAVIVSRSFIRHRYEIAAPGIAAASRWGRAFASNAFATGLLWGLTGSVVLVTPDPMYHVFIIFVLGGMMAGGIVTNSAYMPAMLAFMLPTILPAIVMLISRGHVMQLEMGVMLTIFAAVLLIAGRNINRSIIENFRIRIGQDVLLAKLRASEAAMAEAQRIAHVGSWECDPRTNTSTWSTEIYRILGMDPATSTPSQERMLARVHPDDLEMVEKSQAESVILGTDGGMDHRIVMDDGALKWVHETARKAVDAEGRALRVAGTLQDITTRKSAENDLQFANVLLKTQMEASLDGILIVDANLKIISFNQRFADMWNLSAGELAGGNDAEILAKIIASVRDPGKFHARVQYLYAHPGEDSHDEFRATDGRFIDRYTVTLYTAALVYLGRAWFFRDISEQKRIETLAVRMARFDVLTGLANRSVFVEALQHAIAAAQRGEKSFAVLYLDLDRFKDVNDTLGHPVGDELLKCVADRLQSNTRATDTVARFGGDEFAVVVTDIADPADAAILADTLIKAIGTPFAIEGSDIHSSASIGIATYGAEAPDAETLLSHADVALYRAKSEGRGAYRFFTDAMDAEVQTRVTLGAELRNAVDAGQLFLMYQPQVTIDTGRITGVEALVRWRHPRRGVLGPGLFIPIAEQIGIIAKIGHWVLWTACRQAKAWLDAGIAPVRMSVNASALQFRTPVALEADIAAALAQTRLPAHLLEIELTESVLMDASREHSDVIQRIRDTGVTVAIDDFGTGYSSLEYLRRFPSDRIKIAQNFVTNLETTPGDAAIVRATIGLARELDINVIAEGVETQKQADLLKSWGCEEVQGFYFAMPLTTAEATAVLRTGEIHLAEEPTH